jgi:diaminobutyrate-2-oxoglutarate transaminase
MTSLEIFETLESEVRSYCRSFPTVFVRAQGATLTDRGGRRYLDFFAGAGALNYGHNPPQLKGPLLEYLAGDGITHGLDMATAAKERFLLRFREVVLAPRGLTYKVQFPGPTGTNAVEAALKLARKVTGRATIAYFANGYHGMTLGALAVTGNRAKRAGAGVPLPFTVPLPFDGDGADSLGELERLLGNPSGGAELPAAVILETVQAEGGVRVASTAWLRRVQELCRAHGVLLIVDDIQVGCGRTGRFFSFEEAGLEPDLVTLSKSISGYGLPMALVLLKPELDRWRPGEHNGTFRGNNLAFITGAAALSFWEEGDLTAQVEAKGRRVREGLLALARAHPDLGGRVRGRGLIQGLAFDRPGVAEAVSEAAFARGLIVETAGAWAEVLKLLPPLTIAEEELEEGLGILGEALGAVAREAA